MENKRRQRDSSLFDKFKKLLYTDKIKVLDFKGSGIELSIFLKDLDYHSFYIVNKKAYYIEHKKNNKEQKYYLIVIGDGIDKYIESHIRYSKISKLI